MKETTQTVEVLLLIAAFGQLSLAVLNLFIARILNWNDELKGTSLLFREVVTVHSWFISVTLVIFGVITMRFAHEMVAGTNEALRWFASGIGLFWAIREVLQVFYYSPSHRKGRLDRWAAHITLLLVYGGWATLYLYVAL